ncbi:MAG: hypothetical protein A2992_05710 [Elusimicrobia bacterium RIFCSPLOWO2_01_FULL_59_12]|nr:MAG: hypothetical protein A2992_05710 [Elusimicrobia bacterium RIFCSPLOWO2_01_FULL_59_12]
MVSQAYPIKHRTSAPVDSKYAVKRRGESGLWAQREEEAIQMARGQRIYGGLRTVRRNIEILMQILRDREYTAAFENGKRIYLFNDIDWAATQQDNPVYEVQVTLSGGREADGASRDPLRFAFRVDLERRTVDPGGSGMIRSNTMRAFYDESRIPPEERRGVAKDTEELVRAAQPGASPLALDAASKRYASTYSHAALSRVAEVYGLTLVSKKLAHVTSSVNDLLPGSAAPYQAGAQPVPVSTSKTKTMASASGTIQYLLERGSGKERRLTVRAPSSASPAKLWETLTAYDRLTQYVPDMLVSQREGQDGAAVIVHTISLTRLMFFVFKINLHLRILEHPRQNRLEFERIAGDFEKFSGYIEITPDPTGTRATTHLTLTLVPKGFVPQWALRSMTQNFLLPVLDALRSKAESY